LKPSQKYFFFVIPMASVVAPTVTRRADDIFFPAMAGLILVVVFIGFAQSYFLPGLVFAKLPNILVHIHGALFVSWIFLLILQNLLVVLGRIRWHMRLGILGVIFLPLMVVFGVLTLFDSIRRNGTGLPPELLLAADLEALVLFVGITTWGLIARRNAATHKRLMILGTMAILGPAIDRWPFPDAIATAGTIGVYILMPLIVVAYDLFTIRRVHRATAVASALIIVYMLTVLPVSHFSIWRHAVVWILHA
jgi:hypothetical protein